MWVCVANFLLKDVLSIMNFKNLIEKNSVQNFANFTHVIGNLRERGTTYPILSPI